MKRHNWKTVCILAIVSVSGLCLAQSGIHNPVYKPHARFVVPVVQQPEFSGTVTNISTNTVFDLSGWTTNIVQFSTWDTNELETVISFTNTAPEFTAVDLIATNTAAAVNMNTVPYCDFLLFAVEQGGGVVFSVKSWSK